MANGAVLEQHDDWRRYRKTATVEARPYQGEPLDGVSIGDADKAKGCPKAGDMIARQPHDHTDQWLIEAETFKGTYDPTPVE